MAEALQIDPSSEPFSSSRSTSVYSNSLKEDARSVFIDSCCVVSVINHLFHNCFCNISSCCLYRKDLKFVAEVEEEIKNLVELTNKVRRSSFGVLLPLVVTWGIGL